MPSVDRILKRYGNGNGLAIPYSDGALYWIDGTIYSFGINATSFEDKPVAKNLVRYIRGHLFRARRCEQDGIFFKTYKITWRLVERLSIKEEREIMERIKCEK